MKRTKLVIIVSGMVLACGTMAMAANETVTWTGSASDFIGEPLNYTPIVGGNVTVSERRHLVIDNSTTNITRLTDNNTWLDDGTTVDPADPAVGGNKWGGRSMELSGTGYISNTAANKNGLWNMRTLRIGEVGVGSLDQSGGTLDLSPGNGDQTQFFNSQGELRIGGFTKNGVDWNGIGTYTMTGGLLTNHGPFGSAADATGWVRLGESGTGTLSVGGTAVVDLIAVSTEGVVNPSLAAMTLGANVIDTGTNNALLEVIGTGATVNIDTLAMMGGFTNTIKFDLDGGAVSPINVAGGIADVGGVGVYIADGGWIELTGYENLVPGAVIDLINSASGFLGTENLYLEGQAYNDATLGLDGTGTIFQATIVLFPNPLPSVATGPWNEESTWGDELPTVDHDVLVGSHTITVTENAQANSLQIREADGKLIVDAGAVLSLTEGLTMAAGSQLGIGLAGTAPGRIDAGGDVSLDGELELRIDGGEPFSAGTYTLISTAEPNAIEGTLLCITDLDEYVSEDVEKERDESGLVYDSGAVTLTLDKHLNQGDANLDAVTDVRDFNKWNAAKFTNDTEWTTGDFNGDGITDVRDFNKWNAAKFTSASAQPVEGQVPEPSTIALLTIALTFATVGWWRRRRSA